ncbi:hypothetical protein FGADI_2478 [Fusarium gaditjirri]|uniref:Nephrocystin 3-like N-terminal domain-containing protein n=1 Tax=Fusarium gaditjirri TaxID=282569 RepID=A0A8H4TI34_9HYPO|nr:hypothetical protein FGADI_2478 [Fusarium gaditjirri]
MATGLEIIGAVCALYQVIHISTGIISECKAVYDGESTTLDDMEEHVKNLAEACDLTRARCETMGPSEKLPDAGKRVQKTASKCRASAQALLCELRYVKEKQESSDCMGAVAYVVRSKFYCKKIERMEARFKNDQQELQTILQFEILSQNKVKTYVEMKGFENLEKDIRILIDQGSKGHFGLQRFIEAKQEATNKLIVQECAKVQQLIKGHFTTERTEAQRNEFLQSFRYPEMRQRYNDVLDSSEASFDRVFASYKRLTANDNDSGISEEERSHSITDTRDEVEADLQLTDGFDGEREGYESIDLVWSNFIKCLGSSDSLFCIRGKPGSGKSTLIKFIVDNPNTQLLLHQSNPEAIIFSHFFWKIGSSAQNTIKGLLCSLVYQLLRASQELLELAMSRHGASPYLSPHDWPVKDLKDMLYWLLENLSRAICLFLDGLDEVANADGLDKLTEVIEEILNFPQPKFAFLAGQRSGPEMISVVHRTLRPFLLSKKIGIAAYQHLTSTLVCKAQGVFLWTCLVLRSLKEGIMNGDSVQSLIERLDQLPSEIHDLVWKSGLITLEEVAPNRVCFPREKFFSVFVEIKLSYLITCLFSILKPFLKKRTTIIRIKRLSPDLEESLPRVRLIFNQDKSELWTCERVTSQKGCKQLVSNLFALGSSEQQTKAYIEKDTRYTNEVSGFIWSLTRDLNAEICDLESAMLSLAAEKLHVCTYEEAVFPPPYRIIGKRRFAKGWPYLRMAEELAPLL